MPRTLKDAQITTKAARERLAARHQPYWKSIDAGAAIGYRKGTTGGMWLARVVDPTAGGGYRQQVLGRADDELKDAGDNVLKFYQAEAKAREWIARHHRVAAGLEPELPAAPAKPYTVADCIADYLADYEARGGKALATARRAVDAHILPELGQVVVGRLTRDKIKAWHRALAASAPRLRSKDGQTRHRDTKGDPEAPRRRQSTANRVLTVLKAALNHARAEGKVTCPADPWASVKAFREADKPKVRYLLEEEITRLVNVCPPDFRELVTGALLTGCRYGELAAMKAADFDPQAGTITVGRSKGGKPRHVALTDEGRRFFDQVTAGKHGAARIFERNQIVKQATRDTPAEIKRSPWGNSDQFRSMREACKLATIAPASFHELRHTYGSRLAMKGVPMAVIAAQLGHADTRMTERHYAHMGPGYIAETVRLSFGTLGIIPESDTVARMRRAS
jgi:integrase